MAGDNLQKMLGDSSLAIYLRGVKKFDEAFCRDMISGDDFTIRLEVHGCKSKLLHCRVYVDEIERPSGKNLE